MTVKHAKVSWNSLLCIENKICAFLPLKTLYIPFMIFTGYIWYISSIYLFFNVINTVPSKRAVNYNALKFMHDESAMHEISPSMNYFTHNIHIYIYIYIYIYIHKWQECYCIKTFSLRFFLMFMDISGIWCCISNTH